MSFRNIGISDEAYARLKKFKLAGDSFSAVILRELPEPCATAGAVEDYFKEHGVPEANPRLRRAMLAPSAWLAPFAVLVPNRGQHV